MEIRDWAARVAVRWGRRLSRYESSHPVVVLWFADWEVGADGQDALTERGEQQLAQTMAQIQSRFGNGVTYQVNVITRERSRRVWLSAKWLYDRLPTGFTELKLEWTLLSHFFTTVKLVDGIVTVVVTSESELQHALEQAGQEATVEPARPHYLQLAQAKDDLRTPAYQIMAEAA